MRDLWKTTTIDWGIAELEDVIGRGSLCTELPHENHLQKREEQESERHDRERDYGEMNGDLDVCDDFSGPSIEDMILFSEDTMDYWH